MTRPQKIDLQKTEVTPVLRAYPTKLFVETTTSCNLGCFMCVKQTGACGILEGEMSLATFAALEASLPRAEALILNGVGEPCGSCLWCMGLFQCLR